MAAASSVTTESPAAMRVPWISVSVTAVRLVPCAGPSYRINSSTPVATWDGTDSSGRSPGTVASRCAELPTMAKIVP